MTDHERDLHRTRMHRLFAKRLSRVRELKGDQCWSCRGKFIPVLP